MTLISEDMAARLESHPAPSPSNPCSPKSLSINYRGASNLTGRYTLLPRAKAEAGSPSSFPGTAGPDAGYAEP